ncbi:MAG: Oxygen-independent coproporphyrinogen-III oxidase-like protein [Phycisphaerae bacterium]|nr:Oxygen-independent coproporphyrinogen-III oxidase-like protein [Phycisphaerae bacterium]
MSQLPTLLDDALAAAAPPEGLYIHIPFCRHRCSYCDFYTLVLDEARAGEFVEALLAELAAWRARVDLSAVRTVFIGGGTPTVLPEGMLERIVAAAREAAGPLEEFTVEANPATVDAAKARRLGGLGVDRLSFGAQSFDADELRRLDRIHDVDAIAGSVAIARDAGFDNVNLDLMFGVPSPADQPAPPGALERWRANLAAAVALGVEHLSCYGLTYEPNTPLTQRVRMGRVTPVDDDLSAAMYRATLADLRAEGFEHYEISNWARPGRQCRHNLIYWHNRPWVAIGPSAAGYLGGVRYKVAPHLGRYLGSPGDPPLVDVERLDGAAAAGEAAFLALRLREGLDVAAFAARYGADPEALFAEPIARHLRIGTLERIGGRLRLADAALPVADSVLADFVAAAETGGQRERRGAETRRGD